MLENVVVILFVGGFVVFSVWGLRVAAQQARQDVEEARARRASQADKKANSRKR